MSTTRSPRRTTGNLDLIDRGLADWPDGGCALHPHCLTCPFPRCVHETPGARLRPLVVALRIHRRRAAGEPVAAILAAEGIATRTYYRYLALARTFLTPPSDRRAA
jgi:hypothetical protein